MPYTLAKGALWYVLALVLGLIIGYILRSIIANRQLRAARAASRPDSGEVDRLRGRIANLEPVVAERDRLRAELAGRGAAAALPSEDLGHQPALVDGDVEPADGGAEAVAAAPDPADQTGADVAADDETERPEPEVASASSPPVALIGANAAPPPEPDLGAAAGVLGTSITYNDLTVIEGVGPAIADLCHGIGIDSWWELSNTEVSLLRTMLDDAGPRYRVHQPDTWPAQARLLAVGDWAGFKQLTDDLDGGRSS